jgi:DNA polymerase III subunit gamma/tau
MSYIALARKWRPRTFAQLLGQNHINKALINSLNQQRLHHAYLFTGTRGVGKTSVARLLAKALNCEQGISSTPCLTCDACLAIEQGRFVDLIEIDGASRTRVEDTRELLDNIHYAPTNARFKIYLIDEVHMLSQHSFNALLKTLEEPPSHVKFLLATTDPQKLPVTILSRCLQFNLKHVQPSVICQHLQHILDNEQFIYDVPALTLLANAARGSIRDALSLLDQAIASCDGHLHMQDVRDCLGYTQEDYALQLLVALTQLKTEQVLFISQKIAEEGGHFDYVLGEMLRYLHQISINQSLPNASALISPSTDVSALSVQLAPEDTQLFYQIALKGVQDMPLAPSMTIGFEMTLLRMLAFRPAPSYQMPPQMSNDVKASNLASSEQSTAIPAQERVHPDINSNLVSNVDPRLRGDDTQPEKATLSIVSPDRSEPHAKARTIPLPDGRGSDLSGETMPKAEKASDSTTDRDTTVKPQALESLSVEEKTVSSLSENTSWGEMITQLKLTGLTLHAAENAQLLEKSEGRVTLSIAKGHQSVFTPSIINRLEDALSRYYKEKIKLFLNSEQLISSSPAQQKEKIQAKQQQDMAEALQNDACFQQLQEEFSAQVIKKSISPVKNDL